MGVYTKFDHLVYGKVVSEIGFYSWSLSDNGEILEEGMGDYLIRSKKYGTDEGGICTGFAFVDSMTLV
jgi:hypothetical protein